MKGWAQLVCERQTKEFCLGILGALGFDLDDGTECTLSKIGDYTNFEGGWILQMDVLPLTWSLKG